MARITAILTVLGAVLSLFGAEERPNRPVDIQEKTKLMEPLPGYFPLYWEEKTGKLWMEIGRFGAEFLYLGTLPTGVGSNDIGLDRGQMGTERIVRFDRVGPRVLLVQPNYHYRAITESEAERRAVRESFAESVLWGFEVSAESGGRVLVDATEFFLRDAHGVTRRLEASEQGEYELDESRSAVYLPRTKNFPANTEVEATLTFTGQAEGDWIRSVSPTPGAVTVRQHHSFIELPGPGYEPREFDPRAGFFSIAYRDYAVPIDAPVTRRFIARHRLKKRDPGARMSEPVEPIVYYLDPGVPEPVRSVLLDGARRWNQAFEAAGYRNAFRVDLLPEDADPMDIRYNVIQWVHRSTRGWSYGASVVDPRTGEILKGKVSLGSLRVRQDYLIAEALLAPYADGESAPRDMREMALARLRQLSVHEVGHTLGLSHNYIASAQGRSSVMDYPHPLVKLDANGGIDLSGAYAVGVGEWDKTSIAYGYQDFPEGTDEKRALAAILDDARKRGFTFLSDQDARPAGSAHPQAHLWDNGADAAEELNRIMEVRAAALERFGANNIRAGEPMATLEEALVPLYLFHRYQTEAAAKTLGGLRYSYALRGDGQTPLEGVPAQEQEAALAALLETISPEALTLPERILKLIPPRPMGFSRHRETFPSRTGLAFDPLSAAEVAANHTIGLILHPDRASRLVEHHAMDAAQPGLPDVIEALVDETWKARRRSGLAAEVQRMTDHVALYHLMALAIDDSAIPQVRAIATAALTDLHDWLAPLESADPVQAAHTRLAAAEILRFLNDPSEVTLRKPAEAPPGQPI